MGKFLSKSVRGPSSRARSAGRNNLMAMKNCRPRLFLGKRKSRLDGRLFTVTERLAIAQRIAERLCPPGETRQGRPSKSVENSTNLEKGRTDEIAAKGAGFGSKDTYRAAQKVVERGIPELVEAMDTKKPAR